MISITFFFNDTATTEIYTLSLHDALPIFTSAPLAVKDKIILGAAGGDQGVRDWMAGIDAKTGKRLWQDRKSTRLNSSHSQISYADFCLKKKKPEDPSRRRHVGTRLSMRTR